MPHAQPMRNGMRGVWLACERRVLSHKFADRFMWYTFTAMKRKPETPFQIDKLHSVGPQITLKDGVFASEGSYSYELLWAPDSLTALASMFARVGMTARGLVVHDGLMQMSAAELLSICWDGEDGFEQWKQQDSASEKIRFVRGMTVYALEHPLLPHVSSSRAEVTFALSEDVMLIPVDTGEQLRHSGEEWENLVCAFDGYDIPTVEQLEAALEGKPADKKYWLSAYPDNTETASFRYEIHREHSVPIPWDGKKIAQRMVMPFGNGY